MLHRHAKNSCQLHTCPRVSSIDHYIFLDRNTGVYLNYYFFIL